MTMKDLQVTVDFERARSRGLPRTEVDIATLLKSVPSALIVAGDPSISVQVRIDERQQDRLRAAVGELCVIEDYVDLELYARPRRPFGSSF